MRILMLTDRLAIGGAETHIYELARELRHMGHSVTLASAGGAYAEKMQREGFLHRYLPFDKGKGLSLLAARRALLRLLRCGDLDIVHAHARLPAFLAMPLCRRLGIPFVTTAHWVFCAEGWRGRLSRWGAHTFAVSADIQEYLQITYAIPRENMTVICNGINTNRFTPAPAVGFGRLLHISRLDEGRAACAATLLRIAPRLATGGVCQSITIVGGGDQEKALRAEADALNIRLGFPFIRMTGAQTDILPYLRQADAFVGVSRAALEAMACGLPVILAGDEGYLSVLTKENAARAIEGNLCCRGAPPIEDEKLFRDITAVLQGEGDGSFGRQLVEEQYSAQTMAKRVLAVYSRFVKKQQGDLPPVTVCGYYGAQNAGDDAVLAHLIARLRQEGFETPGILGRRASDTPYPTMGRRALLGNQQIFRKGGVFVLGGGNLLQNETSDRSLRYYTHLLYRAKQAGCRTVVLGGIGRLDERGERMVRRAIALTDGFLLRTPQDIETLTAIAPQSKKPVRLLPDGALWTQTAKELPRGLPQGDISVFALRSGNEEEGTRAATLAAWLAERGLTVTLAIMQRGVDDGVAQAIAARIPGAQILPHMTADEWVAFLSRCRMVYATRLHALIFAAVAGTPSITHADGGKISAFAAYAAECGGQHLLTCLPTHAPHGAWLTAAEAALSSPPTADEKKTYLDRLRSAGENFSFADFFGGLA